MLFRSGSYELNSVQICIVNVVRRLVIDDHLLVQHIAGESICTTSHLSKKIRGKSYLALKFSSNLNFKKTILRFCPNLKEVILSLYRQS